MAILVPVKRVPDYETKIRIKPDGSGIVSDGIKWIPNPFDEIAVEEALKIKERGEADEVVVVGIGPAEAATQLRNAMAMGADRGILVKTDDEVDSDLAARVLAAIYKQGTYELVIMGKQSIDTDASQTPQLLSFHLGIPQACFASKVELLEGQARVTREVDGGLETILLPRPCVISTDLRLNEPRYASLPGIMKAKKKQLDEIELASLNLAASSKVEVLSMRAPEARKAGKKVESVDALINALKNEARVL
jgi:electron transfer flavoprotein beta subunit